jgi:hypothetical protein
MISRYQFGSAAVIMPRTGAPKGPVRCSTEAAWWTRVEGFDSPHDAWTSCLADTAPEIRKPVHIDRQGSRVRG